MKLILLSALSCVVLSNCAELPARHLSSGQFDRAFLSGAHTYLGESEDHAFLRKSNGALLYSDVEYLEPEVQQKIKVSRKRYNGLYSRIPEH
jgi:hypothetical protein